MTVYECLNGPLETIIIAYLSLNSLTFGVIEKSLCWIDDEIVTTGIELNWRNAMRLDWLKNILRLIFNDTATALFMLFRTIIYFILFYFIGCFNVHYYLARYTYACCCFGVNCPKKNLSPISYQMTKQRTTSNFNTEIMKIIGMTLKNRKLFEL